MNRTWLKAVPMVFASGVVLASAPLATAAISPASAVVAEDSSELETCYVDVELGTETCYPQGFTPTDEDAYTEQLSDADAELVDTSDMTQSGEVGEIEEESRKTVIGTFWNLQDQLGSDTQYIVSGGCDRSRDIDWQLGNVGDKNDTFASGRGFSGCQVKVFENQNFGGSSLGFFQSRNTFGVLNNDVTSIKWQ